jgi:hypothetical protein
MDKVELRGYPETELAKTHTLAEERQIWSTQLVEAWS